MVAHNAWINPMMAATIQSKVKQYHCHHMMHHNCPATTNSIPSKAANTLTKTMPSMEQGEDNDNDKDDTNKIVADIINVILDLPDFWHGQGVGME